MLTSSCDLKSREGRKRAAAETAVALVQDGMIVGLGTGTTAAFAIAALAHRAQQGLRITAVASSLASARQAVAVGLMVLDFETMDYIDIAIDGVDEIMPGLQAIKGAGGAMLREKIVAAAAGLMIIVADDSKQVTKIGVHALPVEILPFATGFVTRQIENLGARVTLRKDGAVPRRTDQQNVILDCNFGLIEQPAVLAATLSAIPGVLGHGLFLDEIDVAYVGTAAGVLRMGAGA